MHLQDVISHDSFLDQNTFTSIAFCFSGLGYIVGANVAEAFHAWQFALRVSSCKGELFK